MGEKRQKVPHAESMELELAYMQMHNSSNNPYSARNVVRILEPPLQEENAAITEERVNIVRRRFIHMKREARQRGMIWQHGHETTILEPTKPNCDH